MTAEVVHSPRVEVSAGPFTLPPIPRVTQAYTAVCYDEACAQRNADGKITQSWHGPLHLVGYESAPNMEAILDADEHNREHHSRPRQHRRSP